MGINIFGIVYQSPSWGSRPILEMTNIIDPRALYGYYIFD